VPQAAVAEEEAARPPTLMAWPASAGAAGAPGALEASQQRVLRAAEPKRSRSEE